MDRIIHYSLSPVSVSVSAFPDFDIECVKCFVFTSPQVPASASSQAVSLSLSAINGVLICVLQPTLDTSLELTAALHDLDTIFEEYPLSYCLIISYPGRGIPLIIRPKIVSMLSIFNSLLSMNLSNVICN